MYYWCEKMSKKVLREQSKLRSNMWHRYHVWIYTHPYICAFIKKDIFYWSTVALQGCVSFYCTAKWTSYTYTYIPFLGVPSHLGHHRALCYTAGSHCCLHISILYTHQSQSPRSSPTSAFLMGMTEPQGDCYSLDVCEPLTAFLI